MSMRIFARAAGCDRSGEWLPSNVWVVVLPPMAPSTVAINHVILICQRNRAILRAADVMARHRAKSSRRNVRWGDGAGVRFVAMKLRRRMGEFGLRHVAEKRSFEQRSVGFVG